MRWWWVLVIAGCGRIGFDATSDAVATDAALPGFFISPTGSDGNPGTRDLPWLTFSHALAGLRSGEQLILLDGDYDSRGPVGPLLVACDPGSTACDGAPCPDGIAGKPIVVSADHYGKAFVHGGNAPIHIRSCVGWSFRHLRAESQDDTQDVNSGFVLDIDSSSSIDTYKTLLGKPNRAGNHHVIEISNSSNVTIDQTEVYDFHRAAAAIYLSSDVAIHAFYANGRGYADIPAYTSVCPTGGDLGILSYYATRVFIDNAIIEGTCYGIDVQAGRFASGANGWGDDHTITNAIVVGPGILGMSVTSDCDANARCDATPDNAAANNLFQNVVTYNFPIGFRARGIATRFVNASAIGTNNQGMIMDVLDPAGGLPASAYVASSLVAATSGAGVTSANQTDWAVSDTNVSGATAAFVPNDAHVTGGTTLDPALGNCVAYLPPTSPMRTAGPGGTAIGADLRTTAANGVQTANPFWNPTTLRFGGCGNVVPGVNDDPTTSCIGVHVRLGVGQPGCPAP